MFVHASLSLSLSLSLSHFWKVDWPSMIYLLIMTGVFIYILPRTCDVVNVPFIFAQIIFKWRVFMFVQIKVALGVCFVLNSWKEYLLLFTYLMTLGKVVTFPLITTFKTNMPPNYLFVEYRIKMWPHRLIHAINKPVLNLNFRFEFFIRKLDNSLCTSLIIRLTCILWLIHTKMWLDIR